MCRPFGLKGVSRVEGQRSATFDDRAASPRWEMAITGRPVPARSIRIDANSDDAFDPAKNGKAGASLHRKSKGGRTRSPAAILTSIPRAIGCKAERGGPPKRQGFRPAAGPLGQPRQSRRQPGPGGYNRRLAMEQASTVREFDRKCLISRQSRQAVIRAAKPSVPNRSTGSEHEVVAIGRVVPEPRLVLPLMHPGIELGNGP